MCTTILFAFVSFSVCGFVCLCTDETNERVFSLSEELGKFVEIPF